MLNPAAALCSLFTGHIIQTLLKIVRLLCITISVGRSRSVKNKWALDIHPVRCYYP
jgi:hypothetical protein